MKREIIAATLKRVFLTGCVFSGAVAFCSWAPVTLAAAPALKSYAGLTCEQLSFEYDRLNRSLLSDGASAGAGAVEGISSAVVCGPGEGAVSGESTARGLDRAIMTSDVLQRIRVIKEVHQGAGCTTKLEMSKAAGMALAEEKSVGERDYRNSCARCHGDSGKGSGWFGKYLKQRPPPLAQIKKNNGGVFPSDHLYEVIEGRKDMEVHGPRDMPLWGRIYITQADKKQETYVGQLSSVEQMVRIRIRALVNYIAQFQE